MELKEYTFSKEEKLCSTRSIDTLFSSGKSFVTYPLRIIFRIYDEDNIADQYSSVMISVSKKKFKRAVKRNRVKRLFREAYRLNKYRLDDTLLKYNKRIDIAFLFLKSEVSEYIEIEKATVKAITILISKIEEVE